MRRRTRVTSSENENKDEQRQGSTEIREHLANERTLLSWVRTGVSLISLGLVVERAGALAKAADFQVSSTSGSEFFGLGLDYDVRVPGLLQAVTRDEVHEAARRAVDPSNATVVVAGPYDGPLS